MEGITLTIPRIRSSAQSIAPSILYDSNKDIKSAFWQEWQAHQHDLYRYCLKWMNSNSIDAEEVLSQAMFKAWNEWQNSGRKIKYPKAWLTRIIRNFCMDVYRKRQRDALVIENIDDIKFEDYSSFYSRISCSEAKILDREMRVYLRHKIDSLPIRLREPFVLYYRHHQSYQDIAKHFACSEENVRKCIRKACRILQRYLIKYLAGKDDTPLYSSSPSLQLVTPLEEKSQLDGNWESSIPTTSQDEEINYQFTVLCQEALPHHWYSSNNLLIWR